jgi:hypothetical protein
VCSCISGSVGGSDLIFAGNKTILSSLHLILLSLILVNILVDVLAAALDVGMMEFWLAQW